MLLCLCALEDHLLNACGVFEPGCWNYVVDAVLCKELKEFCVRTGNFVTKLRRLQM
jgi:hypothetical protein